MRRCAERLAEGAGALLAVGLAVGTRRVRVARHAADRLGKTPPVQHAADGAVRRAERITWSGQGLGLGLGLGLGWGLGLGLGLRLGLGLGLL